MNKRISLSTKTDRRRSPSMEKVMTTKGLKFLLGNVKLDKKIKSWEAQLG